MKRMNQMAHCRLIQSPLSLPERRERFMARRKKQSLSIRSPLPGGRRLY